MGVEFRQSVATITVPDVDATTVGKTLRVSESLHPVGAHDLWQIRGRAQEIAERSITGTSEDDVSGYRFAAARKMDHRCGRS
jgi:hypothetical protein